MTRFLCPILGAVAVCVLGGCGREPGEEMPEAHVESEIAQPGDAAPTGSAAAGEPSGPGAAEDNPIDAGDPPLPEDAAEPAAAPGARATAADLKGYEAWFERYGLDLNDPAMLDADPDGDGYSNRDEFLVDTDPKDATSHPGFHPVMRLRKFEPTDLPLVLEKVSDRKGVVRNSDTGKTSTVAAGDVIPGTSFKVKRVVSQIESDKFGQTTDVSRLTVEDTESGEIVSFIKDMAARSPDSAAELTSAKDPSVNVRVKQGAEFAWPGEPDRKYLVVDLRPEQVVVKQLDTGEVWTIPMERPKP